MKTIMLTTLALASCVSLQTSLLAQANLKEDPAYLNIDGAFDFKSIEPTVNVNVPKFLLNAALAEFDGGDDDPIASLGINIKELTQEIKLIRVVVLEVDDEQEEVVAQGVAKLREQLEKDWMAIVSVPDDNVFIYARSDASGEKMAGVAILVADGGDVVIGNLVGNVPIGKIAKLAAQMGGEGIPEELIQTLGGLASGGFGGGNHHSEGHVENDHSHSEAAETDTETSDSGSESRSF